MNPNSGSFRRPPSPPPQFTEAEIREAQASLDFHPADSPYWEQVGRDELAVIVALNLIPATSESERRENYRRALLGDDQYSTR